VEGDPDDDTPPDAFPLPEKIRFNDQDESYGLFLRMESNKDGWGAYRYQDTLGMPMIEVSDRLHHDLMLWRDLKDRAERIKAKGKNNG
jgi:hypothetical protein